MLNFAQLAKIEQHGCLGVFCVVTHTFGSTPRKVGSKMLVFDNGTIEGSIGGGAVEYRVQQLAQQVLIKQEPLQVELSLTHELAMCCGGSMTVYLEPFGHIKEQCFIFGAGHISQALCPLAAQADFQVSVLDPRAELLQNSNFDHAKQKINDYNAYELDALNFHETTYAVVATHSHAKDQELIEYLLHKPLAYLALVGSQRKALMTRERALQKGFTQDAIARIVCPAGLKIHAQTPHEIAISIVAQMIAIKRNHDD